MATERLRTGERQRVLVTLLIVAIVVGIAITEWMFAYGNDPRLGITLALFLTIGIYTIVSVTRLGQPFADCADALVLIPIYILFTASLPWFFINNQFLLPAVYSLILALCFWYIQSKDISLVSVGLRKDKLLKYILLGIALGIPIGAVEYFVLMPAPAFPAFELKYLVRDAVYMTLFVGLGEELLFRGLIQRQLSKIFGWKWALFGQAFIFMVMHLTWRSLPELGFTFVVGFLLGYIYYRTGSLMWPIILHGAGNTVLVAVMPYLFG